MIKPVAWIDDCGRLVRSQLIDDGGYVDFNSAIPDSWQPVIRVADIPEEALQSCINVLEFEIRMAIQYADDTERQEVHCRQLRALLAAVTGGNNGQDKA